MPLNIFLFEENKSQFYIINNGYNNYSKFVPQMNNNSYLLRPFCYIPNISSSIKFNKNYDSIICLSQHRSYNYPTLLLFETNGIKLNNNNIKCNSYISTIEISQRNSLYNRSPNQFLFCGNKHGIIYEDDRILYQLKLKDININSNLNNFKFTKMEQNKNKFFESPYSNYWNCYGLSMNYFKNEEKIFVINCFYTEKDCSHQRTSIRVSYAKCGIFDLNKYEWKQIETYKYNHYYDDYHDYDDYYHNYYDCMIGICQNNQYDINSIYTLTNYGHTSKYDIHENKWIKLYEDLDNEQLQFVNNKLPMLWMDDNPYILYCYNNKKFCFDIRDNDTKWIQINDMKFIFDQMSANVDLFL